MMIIVYKSNTGYTEQYAKLLGDALDMPSYSLEKVPKCHKGGEVIYLGWLFAGNIVGYKKAAKLYKVRCVCGVGMGAPTPSSCPASAPRWVYRSPRRCSTCRAASISTGSRAP